MDRRTLVGMVAGGLLTTRLAAYGQPSGRVYRLGVLRLDMDRRNRLRADRAFAWGCPSAVDGGLMLRAIGMFLAAVVVMAGLPALAQEYPARPVKIIVPFAAGGPADIYARFLAQRLEVAIGQPFIVDNRPGAGSVIGTDAAAKSAPDGYTLLLMSNTHTVNESLVPNKPYALLRDFIPVAPVNYSDLVLVVHPAVAANNLAELLALAKSKPGKLNYASSGPGTPYHMAGELFKAMGGGDIVHVPYKGSSQARTDTIGGQVDMMFDAVTTMSEFAKAGKVGALAP